MNAKQLWNDYQEGVGFKTKDVLRPKAGAFPCTFDVIDKTMVVISQSSLAPHQYIVVGENPKPHSPADRFVKFEINGHDWEHA